MDREYVDIETPVSKEKVVLKAWLTGREKRAIQSVYLNESSFSGDSGVQIKGDLVNKAQDVAIKTVVVSVGDIKDDEDKVLNHLLDMHDRDYQFVVDSINKLMRDKEEESKKK